jgi:hypothetical protein
MIWPQNNPWAILLRPFFDNKGPQPTMISITHQLHNRGEEWQTYHFLNVWYFKDKISISNRSVHFDWFCKYFQLCVWWWANLPWYYLRSLQGLYWYKAAIASGLSSLGRSLLRVLILCTRSKPTYCNTLRALELIIYFFVLLKFSPRKFKDFFKKGIIESSGVFYFSIWNFRN